MIIGKTKAGEIIAKLLPSSFIDDVRYYYRKERIFEILDRWALNSPEKLILHYNNDPYHLMFLAEKQNTIEENAMSKVEFDIMWMQGMSIWEIFKIMKINTELT